MNRIRVGVVKRKDCRNLVMRYKDPVTGLWSTATRYTAPQTGEVFETGDNRKEAKKLAALWEADLNARPCPRPLRHDLGHVPHPL